MSHEVEQVEKRTGLFNYFKESFMELKKVVWYNRPEAVRMTGFVIAFVFVFALYIFVVDSVIAKLFEWILVR